MKGIRGSDRRKFILDLARLSPRDANWIGVDDEYLCCLIRPEAISHFITSKNFQYAKEQIKQEMQDKKSTTVSKSEESSVVSSENKPEQEESKGENTEKKGLTYEDYINKLQEYFVQGENKTTIKLNPNLFTRVQLANKDSPKIEGIA